MTALPSSVSFGLMMISRSIPSCSITRFRAIQLQSAGMVEMRDHQETQTLEIEPKIIRVEDLEFTDYAQTIVQKPSTQASSATATHWT